jgi:large subunit ribosomal protein L10
MKELKQVIIDELLERINQSPFMLVTDYTGLTVPNFAELRNRLQKAGSECHVVKNAYVKRAAKDVELPEELNESLSGQTAIVTGEEDVTAAARVLKEFAKEFDKLSVKAGVLDGKLISAEQVQKLADIPSREVLFSQLLGVIQAPATKLAQLLDEPGAKTARLMNAYSEKEG